MRRFAAFATSALAVWVLGSALGAIQLGANQASAGPTIMVSSAHAGFSPDLSGNRPISRQ